jgi:putative membrane protein
MMARKSCLAAALVAAAALAPGCAVIQSRAQVSPVDQQFMLTAASVSTAEIDLGQLAMRQSSNPAVRQFGQQMVEDHTRVNAELGKVADAKNVVLLKAMDPANRTLYAELSKLSGPAFDRQYMLSQVNIHRMGNALYLSQAQNGQDQDVRSFAARNAPVGIEHLRMAESMMR